jgi:hypothetical protein
MSDSRQMEMADACGTVFHGQNNKKKEVDKCYLPETY